MSQNSQPTKAIYLKPGQRRLPQQEAVPQKGGWEVHRGDSALDAWGTGIRDMKNAGTFPAELQEKGGHHAHA
jgi:hypothetical protein